jgi:uridine kinase
MPVYDFATHSRKPASRTVVPGPIVIVDGLFCLYWKEIRELLDARVFVELDHATCLARRIDRDTRRRGRTADSVRKQYEETVRPMFERYVGPTRAHANLVLSGAGDPEENATAVLAHFGLASSGA